MPVPFCAPADRRPILWAAILASSMGFIDSSVTSIAVPAMRAGLGASLAEVQWIGAAYLLTLSALVLTGGAMGDRFGIARIFTAGIWIFVLASLACAIAATPGQMIAARAVKGVGAALMVPGSMAMVSSAFPRAERGRALGLWAAASTATTALGPVLGGLMISWGGEMGWRAVFALNLPLGLLSVWLLRGRITGDQGRPGTPVDWPGALLATLALVTLAYGLTEPAAPALPCAVVVLVCTAAFLWWENRAPAPMIRLSLFANRSFAMANLATLTLYFALNGIGFYLPMTAIAAWGVTEAQVTAAFLPVSVLIGVMSAPAGRLADRFGPGPLLAAGSALVALSQAGIAITAEQGLFWTRILPLTVLNGIGLGLVVAPLTAAVMAAASDGEQGAASGINNAVARVAGLIAVALLGRVAASAYGDAGAGFGLPAATPQEMAATARGFAAVAWASAGMAAAAAVIAAVGMRGRREMAAG